MALLAHYFMGPQLLRLSMQVPILTSYLDVKNGPRTERVKINYTLAICNTSTSWQLSGIIVINVIGFYCLTIIENIMET